MIVIATNSDWFITQFTPAMIGQSNYFDISFMTFNRLYSYSDSCTGNKHEGEADARESFQMQIIPPPTP